MSNRDCPPAERPETNWLLLVGLLTWAVVAGIELGLGRPPLLQQPWPMALLNVLGYLASLAGFLLVVALPPPTTPQTGHRLAALGLTLQAGAVLLLQWLEPRSINQILLIMWSSQLPYFLRLPTSVALSALALLINAWLRWRVEPAPAFWFEPLIYFTFSLFGIATSRNAILAEQARAELAQRNAELEATQQLLTASASESERLRIARDLHDSLGHHLTALALQLEILQHQHGPAAEQTAAQARQLVKLLLADVRATVSNLRSTPSLQASTLLTPLLRGSPTLRIDADIADDLWFDEPRTAEAMLRICQEVLTNTWRHARASALRIRLRHHDGRWCFEAEDNGAVLHSWQPGNGLRGVQERVQALGGEASFGPDSEGHFRVQVQLPGAAA